MHINKSYRMISVILITAFLVSCASFEKNVYTGLAISDKAVDLAMRTYGAAVRGGAITPDVQVKVKDLYEKYQKAYVLSARALQVYIEMKQIGANPDSTLVTKTFQDAAKLGQELLDLLHALQIIPKAYVEQKS